ncbi:MAG: hypothetical protein L7F78_24685, partial [Syntrophales bacterium LBB04]|nr:hypothetical protein [Syntrophales bacterium LBB04]
FGADQLHKQMEGEASFKDLLVDYIPGDQPINIDQINYEKKLEDLCRHIAASDWTGSVYSDDIGFTVKLAVKDIPETDTDFSSTIECWPITLSDKVYSRSIKAGVSFLSWNNIGIENLTAFFAFRIMMNCNKGQITQQQEFVVKARMGGMPEDRLSKITASLLSRKEDFVNLLLMILSIDGNQPTSGDFSSGGTPDHGHRVLGIGNFNGLLEMLLTAWSSDPARLERIAGIVHDLRNSEKGKDVLPDEFEQIWNPIWRLWEKEHHDAKDQ